ncbi:MAG: hypothetical protein ACYCSP_09640 [Acidobacteriaceae bacterium]
MEPAFLATQSTSPALARSEGISPGKLKRDILVSLGAQEVSDLPRLVVAVDAAVAGDGDVGGVVGVQKDDAASGGVRADGIVGELGRVNTIEGLRR